jgi:hypothetical protein
LMAPSCTYISVSGSHRAIARSVALVALNEKNKVALDA